MTTGAGIPLGSFFVLDWEDGPLDGGARGEAVLLVGEVREADFGTGMELRFAEVLGALGGLGGGPSGVVGILLGPIFSFLKLFCLADSSFFDGGLVGSFGIRDSRALGMDDGGLLIEFLTGAGKGFSISSSSSSSSESRNGLADFVGGEGTGGAGAAKGLLALVGVVIRDLVGIWGGGGGAAKGLVDFGICFIGGAGATNGLVEVRGEKLIEGGGILLWIEITVVDSLALGDKIVGLGAGLGILLSFFFSKVGKSIIISPSSLLPDGTSVVPDRRGILLLPLLGGGGLMGTVECEDGGCADMGEVDPEEEAEDMRGCFRPEDEDSLSVGLSDSESDDTTLALGGRSAGGELGEPTSLVLLVLDVLVMGCSSQKAKKSTVS